MMKSKILTVLAVVGLATTLLFYYQPAMSADKSPATLPATPEGFEEISLGAGCFWCVEAIFNRLDGVQSAVSAYTGGTLENPTYEQICTGTTGHAEVVHVVYDPKEISTEEILAWFWKAHDPTTLNRQGNDIGTQYRSAIFYSNEAQKKAAEASMAEAQKDFDSPIVTEVTKVGKIYPAENYHQDFYLANKNSNGYCRMVIAPKMKKLGLNDVEKKAQ